MKVPDVLLSGHHENIKKFREEEAIKKTKARYLLKYDKVKIINRGFFTNKTEYYSIHTIEKDFPDMPKAFAAYIRLKSNQKKQARISARINKYKKYYERSTELFARFIEGLYLNKDRTKALAPNTYRQFYDLLNDGYYMELKEVLSEI